MRISKRQAAENRERVVNSAARLFREKGFDGVGVADLMGAAGLTHGGFYNHFASKDELSAAACARALAQSVEAIEAVAELEPDRKRDFFREYRRNYLSRRSRDATAFRCPMVAFGADAPRQSEALRRQYAAGLRRYLDGFARAFRADRGRRRGEADLRAEAIAQFAAMVGAVVLARGVAKADPALSDEILEATLAALEPAGGYSPKSEGRP
ncbi:MAG TPA: TetR/AcrR family transcriptional regulator [Roseiarcus sp.]|nr:TetR/AcrR family transcriptional regulator [Roseiarcus sp.]